MDLLNIEIRLLRTTQRISDLLLRVTTRTDHVGLLAARTTKADSWDLPAPAWQPPAWLPITQRPASTGAILHRPVQ